MAFKYRAYRNGEGCSQFDSDMPKATWNKVVKHSARWDSGKKSIQDLKEAGWLVKRVEVPFTRELPKPPTETPVDPMEQHAVRNAAYAGVALIIVLVMVAWLVLLPQGN